MALDPKQAVAMRDSLLKKLAGEHTFTLRVLEHVPDAKLGYKVSEKTRDFAALATHIYDTGTWFGAIMTKGTADLGGDAPKPVVPATKAALLDHANASNEAFMGLVKGLSPEHLAREIEFFTFGKFPAVTFLDWHISHLIHHRGQLTVYLRAMGAKVPAIYGDSLDYPM
jgi:uncharacterized damage-inducible protein DinB